MEDDPYLVDNLNLHIILIMTFRSKMLNHTDYMLFPLCSLDIHIALELPSGKLT